MNIKVVDQIYGDTDEDYLDYIYDEEDVWTCTYCGAYAAIISDIRHRSVCIRKRE